MERRPHSNRVPPKLDGEGEAKLTMIACSEPPEGRSSQPPALLSERLVALNVVDSISRETVRKTLKKRFETAPYAVSAHSGGEQRRLRMLDGGCAQGLSAEIQRGRGLDLHSRGGQAADEGGPRGFACRSRPAGALRLRIRAQRDGESVHGACAAFRPGHVKITDRRTKKDFAELLRDIADIHFPGKKIVPAMDNGMSCRVFTTLSRRSRRAGSTSVLKFIMRRNTAPG